MRRRSPEIRVALERAKQTRRVARQVRAIDRASRPSPWDGRTLEDELRKLREALADLGRAIVRAVRS